MLIRLSCDQRSKALSTLLSATDRLLGRVFVLMVSQRSRMDRSRSSSSLPLLTDFLNSTIRAARSFQLRVSGVISNLSDANSATTAMAAIVRICWRFLICIGSSLRPLKVERELQRRFSLALWEFELKNFLLGTQLVEHFQERCAITGCSGAGH